jgi:hypothetical protein
VVGNACRDAVLTSQALFKFSSDSSSLKKSHHAKLMPWEFPTLLFSPLFTIQPEFLPKPYPCASSSTTRD